MSQAAPSYCQGEVVRLIVGHDKMQFSVHRNLITTVKFFASCLDSGFAESQTDLITLQEDDPRIVEYFLKWLYAGTFKDLSREEAHVTSYGRLYAFGDKICSEEFCNAVVDSRQRYDESHHLFRTFSCLSRAHELGINATPYAKYILHSLVHEMLLFPENFEEATSAADVHASFAAEVLQTVIKEVVRYQKEPYHSPRRQSGCRYHVHRDDVTCHEKLTSSKRKRGRDGGEKDLDGEESVGSSV